MIFKTLLLFVHFFANLTYVLEIALPGARFTVFSTELSTDNVDKNKRR